MNRASVIIALLAVGAFAVISEIYIPVALLRDMADRYGVCVAAAGLVTTVFAVAYACGFLVFGPLSDRAGRRAVMVPGLGALALASVAVALAPTFGSVLGARAIQGFVAGALPPVALAYLPEALPGRLGTLGIAAVSAGFQLAGILGHLYGAALGSLSAAVLPLSAVYALGAVLVALLPEEGGERDTSLKGILDAYRGLPGLLRSGALLRAYAAVFVVLFGFVAFYSALGLFLAEAVQRAGLSLVSVRAVAVPALLLPLVAAWFIRRFGPRAVAWWGLAVGALGLFAAGAASGIVWLLVAASVVFVSGIAVAQPALIALVVSLAPEGRRGTATSLYGFVLFMGASLGPQLPSLAPFLGFGGVCLLLGVLLAAAGCLNAFARKGAPPSGDGPAPG